jgi:Flp pilus assembly protein TadG
MRPNPDTTQANAACARRRPHTLLTRLHRFGVHNGGATAVVAAILFPVVIGGLGLGAETGYWYLSQRKLQHAVDVSVHAAGARLRADDTDAKIQAAALHIATQSGYSPGTFTVDPHYTSAAYPGAKLVEVVATETRPRMFSAVVAGFFSNEPATTVTLSARAVAMVDKSAGTVACVLALSPTAPRAVSMDGSGSVNLAGCDIASNSNATDALYATSTVSTDCAYSVGGAQAPGLTSKVCDKVKVNQPLIRDPYKDVVEPINPGNCKSRHQGHPTNDSPPLTPGCYNGLTVKGKLEFLPGVYYINGGEFNVNAGDNSRLTGSGVTIYLAGAVLNIGGSIQMNFSAPTDPANPYAGIVIFGARNATTTTHKLAGGSGSDYTGAVYTPASLIEFAGNSKATGGGCTQIIGARVKFTGGSALKSECENAGTEDIATSEVVRIVE